MDMLALPGARTHGGIGLCTYHASQLTTLFFAEEFLKYKEQKISNFDMNYVSTIQI